MCINILIRSEIVESVVGVPEEFVARVQECKRRGKYRPYLSYRITLPKWLVEVYGIRGGDLIRVIYKSKVGKARKKRLTKAETRGEVEE